MSKRVNRKPCSDEHKKNLSLALKGKQKSPEHLAKISETLRRRYASGELTSTFKGRKHTEEARKKISEKGKGRKPWNTGKPLPDHVRQKISKGRKGKLSGKDHPLYGRSLSDEHKEKFNHKGKTHSEEAKRKMSEAHKRRDPFSAEHRRNISESKKGRRNPMYGKSSPHPKKIFYVPCGLWFRSSWELAFAEYLDRIGADWKYEETRYVLKDGGITYLPDFFIYRDGALEKIYEVKGWMDADSIERIDAFREEYSGIPFTVVGRKELAERGISV